MTFRERWERFKEDMRKEGAEVDRMLSEIKKERRKPSPVSRTMLWVSIGFWFLMALVLLPVFFPASFVILLMCYVIYHMYLRRGR